MVATLNDDFNRADGTLVGTGPGTGWQSSGLSVISNRASTTGTSLTHLSHLGNLDSPNHEVSVLISTMGGSGSVGVIARVVDDTNWYLARVNGSGAFNLYKMVNGTLTALPGQVTITAVGSRIGIRAEGSTIQATVNGTAVITATDTALTTGVRTGLRMTAASSRPAVDDFTSNVLGSVTPPDPVAPTVSAGSDASIVVDTTFTRAAVVNDGGSPITSQSWAIVEGPTGIQPLSSTADLTWTPNAVGTYRISFSATNSVGTHSDEFTATVRTPPEPGEGLVAFWDFAQSAPPFTAAQGLASFPLAQGAGSSVTKVADGPLGNAIELDGTTDYLVIPAAQVGDLDAARFGDQVTVAAWVKRTDANQGYIAGLWNEGQELRNYGLFLDLDTYGGNNQVCGHISYDGGPTAGYPYSRDYSASARQLRDDGNGLWRFVAMTYDGAEIRSYLDGQMDSRPSFTDNQGNTYSKNPYPYTLGLNHIDAPCDFTVGGNLVGSTIQNLVAGRIGGLWVYNRALAPKELVDLQRSTLAPTEPVISFDFWFPGTGSTLASGQGWKNARGPSAVDTDTATTTANFLITNISGQHYLYRSNSDTANTSTEGIGYYPTFAGLNLSEIDRITFRLNNSNTTDLLRFVIRVNGSWYASEQTYNSTVAGVSGGDWSRAETKTLIPSRTGGTWRALNFVEGSTLSLGTLVGTELADGEVTAIGFYNPACAGVMRIDDVAVVPTTYVAEQPVEPAAGTVTGTWGYSGTVAGSTARSGSVSGSWGYTGTVSGTTTRSGTVTGSWGFSSTITGGTTKSGDVAGAWGYEGIAKGSTTRSGTVTGTWGHAGTVTGSTNRSGSVDGQWGYDDTVTGSTARSGAVTGSYGWASSVTGAAPAVPGAGGNVTGSWGYTSTVTGAVDKAGTVTGSWGYDSTITGAAPIVAGAGGTVTGAWGYTGAVAGATDHSGTVEDTWDYLSAVTGATSRSGLVEGAWGYSGSISGPLGAAVTTHTYVQATLASNGASAAVLAGDGTSIATLSHDGTSTAVVAIEPAGLATLANDGTSTAVLATDGTSTAVLATDGTSTATLHTTS